MTWGKFQASLRVSGVHKAAPKINQSLVKFWEGFQDLQSQRQYHASGPQPLLFTEIEAYLRLNGGWLPRCLYPKFVRLITVLDNEYLTLYYKDK